MDSSLNGAAGKPLKCRKTSVVKKSRKKSVGRKSRKKSVGKKSQNMSVGKKRQLVHELSKDLDSAFIALKKWSNEDILEVLCLESGEKKKYNKFKKNEMINELLNFVSEEKDSSTVAKRDAKRPRKNDNPTRFDDSGSTVKATGSTVKATGSTVKANESTVKATGSTVKASESTVKANGRTVKAKGPFKCKNLACQGILRREDMFCKRCSCCLCRKFDENKDPSLWLTCDSDPSFPGESCGLSCHLNCAIENEKSGLKVDKPSCDVEGCFSCVACGKTNSLLECWNKQLSIAKETESVDVLCFRLVLAQKLLKGTEKYKKVSETVEEAVKSLETELRGPLADLPSAMCRGNVTRLNSAPKVKDLCSSALKSLQDIMLADHALPCKIPGTTENLVKVVSSSGGKQTSVEETNVSTKTSQGGDGQEEATIVNSLSTNDRAGQEEATMVNSLSTNDRAGQEEATIVNSLSTNDAEEQLALETVPEKVVKKSKSSSSCSFGLAECVKTLRQLEFSGYVDKSFRQKFLTWYGLNASTHEKNVVKAYVDAFEDDPESLAEQLIDSFSESISRKRSATGGSNSSA